MNPEDLAAARHKEIAKAREQIAKVEGALAESRARHGDLQGRLRSAEIRDRERLGAALVAGKPEPDSEAERVEAELAREQQRTDALMAAVQAARREIPKLVEQHRAEWHRRGLREMAKARSRYQDAIAELESARDGLDGEATLVAWLTRGEICNAATDALGGRLAVADAQGGRPISFSRTLEALRGDCQHLASHPAALGDPVPEPRMELIWTGRR